MITNANLVSNTIWAVLETLLIIGGGFRFFYKLNKRLDRIEYQLYENGGSSMKDQMNRQDTILHELQINQAVIKNKLEIK